MTTKPLRNSPVKAVLVAALLFFSCVLSAFGDEVTAMWTRIYGRAQTLQQQIAVMESVAERKDTTFIPFLTDLLSDLNSQQKRYNVTTERLAYETLTGLVVRAVGDLKAIEAAPYVYEVVKTATNPILKGQAIFALGKIGDPSFSDDVALILEAVNLNLDASGADKDGEVIAYSCVLSLERFREPIGFAPLFFASIGWYSDPSQVKQRAAEAMHTILEDPTDILSDLVALEDAFDIKLAALQAEDESTAPAERKSEVAIVALRQGLLRNPRTVIQTTLLAQLRLKAMQMLIENGTADPEPVRLLEEIIYRRSETSERLTAILTLGSNRSDEAIAALIRYLKLQNERQSSGVVPDDYRVIRATIQALGNSGNPAGTEELMLVRHSEWPPAIVRDAEAALEKLR